MYIVYTSEETEVGEVEYGLRHYIAKVSYIEDKDSFLQHLSSRHSASVSKIIQTPKHFLFYVEELRLVFLGAYYDIESLLEDIE